MSIIKEINVPSLVTGKIDDSVTKPIIVTHDGRFHCDDALAVGLLMSLPEYCNSVVVRTRQQEIINLGTVVVDVGGVYDPATLRFDHHQRGFSEVFGEANSTVKLSSAGLVFRHFGKRILEVFGIEPSRTQQAVHKIYESLIQSIDALDNGVDICPDGVKPRFMIRSDLTSRVARLNPEWNEWTDDYVSSSDFIKAIQITMEEFLGHVKFVRDSWLKARLIVEKGFETRLATHASGRVIELDIGCPFEDHVEELESQLATTTNATVPSGLVLFVIYPNTNDKSSWRVKAVKSSRFAFGNRLDLPERLAGCRDDAIAELGFPGVSFVHHARFLAGCKSREACLNLVDKTLAEAAANKQVAEPVAAK